MLRMVIPGVVFGKNPDYYDDVQKQHPENGFFTHWNWAAAFFQIFWMIWRRSYLGALVMAIIVYIATSIFGLIMSGIAPEASILVSCLSYLIPFAIYGAFGNSVYLKFISEKIISLKRKGKIDQEIIEKCKPSWLPVVVYSAIVFGTCFIFGFFVMGLILAAFSMV